MAGMVLPLSITAQQLDSIRTTLDVHLHNS